VQGMQTRRKRQQRGEACARACKQKPLMFKLIVCARASLLSDFPQISRDRMLRVDVAVEHHRYTVHKNGWEWQGRGGLSVIGK